MVSTVLLMPPHVRWCGHAAFVHADPLSDAWQAIRGVPEKEIRRDLLVDDVSREMPRKRLPLQ
jgi:hypothetical protein